MGSEMCIRDSDGNARRRTLDDQMQDLADRADLGFFGVDLRTTAPPPLSVSKGSDGNEGGNCHSREESEKSVHGDESYLFPWLATAAAPSAAASGSR